MHHDVSAVGGVLLCQGSLGCFKDLQLDLQLEPQLDPNSNSNLTELGFKLGSDVCTLFICNLFEPQLTPRFHQWYIIQIILNCTSNFLFPFMPTISERQLLIQEILNDLDEISHDSRMALDADDMRSSDSGSSQSQSASDSVSSSSSSTSSSSTGTSLVLCRAGPKPCDPALPGPALP